jgi:transposase
MVPWAEHRSRYTRAFEEHTAYLAQKCDKSMVASLMRIAWNTVGSVLKRVIERRQTGPRLEGLRRIGIDELSYRKHHSYLTLVTDLDTHRVVWAAQGKSLATVTRFFDELGVENTARLEMISLDLSPGYLQAIRTLAPQAQVVLDRFHAQELVHFALDEVRRDEVNELRKHDKNAARELKYTRWVLLKGQERLTAEDLEKLAVVQARHKRLAHAWALKEQFREVLDLSSAEVAAQRLKDWCNRAVHCAHPALKKVGRTIRKHIEGLAAYVATGLSNGPVEAINGTIRVITRRSFGFHAAENLIALVYSCCSGVELSPGLSNPLPPKR